MPDHGRGSLHRVCDSVSGVNWRPTRFVDELMLTRYACCVCHVIPSTTVVLPCGHALCEQCQAGCVIEDGGSVCPLDGKPFSGDECDSCHLSAKKKRDLKAHCWNEAHGCDFVGTLETILRHFEAECAFHAFPCQQCGESVPNTKLAAHYIGDCANASSSAAQAESSRQGGTIVVTASDVTAAGREIRTSVRYACEDEVTVLQSQVNERAEAARMQSATLASSIEALSASVALAAEKLSELFGEQSQLQQRLRAGLAGESRVAREGGATDAASSSGASTRRRQGTDILRNLEHLVGESVLCLRSLLQVAKSDNKQPMLQLFLLPPRIDEATEGCVDTCASNSVTVNEVVYHALLSNFLWMGTCHSIPIRLHRRDVWFRVAVSAEVMKERVKEWGKMVKITWIAKPENSKLPEVIRVSLLGREGSSDLSLQNWSEKCQQVYLLERLCPPYSRGCYIFEIAIRD
ncbi:uncharacterized protein [Dermacentor andersoni]|uniref:uncharacterized protein n=1 Tax=Dermacentor andersoni TaxID=34620 RepID=UPI00241711D7|nr:uncharacterized protein LOC126527650 [Dermacentor andersoni]